MRRFRQRMPRLVAAVPAVGLAGAVLAQDVPPDDIGSDFLGIAREALDGAGSASDPEASATDDGRPFVTVPHHLGGTEVLPLPEGATATAPESGTPAPDDRIGTTVVTEALPSGTVADTGPVGSDVPSDPAIATVTAPATSASTETADAPASADETPERKMETADSRDPLDLLKGLWREAVASGKTAQGFDAWLSTALRPEPAAEPGNPESQAGRTREVAAAWDRRTGPVTLGKAGRVVTTFGEAIPTAFCSPLRVCYIELEPGEHLTDTPSLGDSVRWQMVMKVQGWDPQTMVFEIKPSADAVETNLVIPTDRRLYTITLVNDPDVHTPILAFRWPDSEARAISDAIERRRAEEMAVEEARDAEAEVRAGVQATEMARSGVPTDAGPRAAELLDFRFRVEGKAAFRPVRVFADGSRTYFDFHPRYRGPLPAIVAGKAEGNAALNTRISASGTRLVADRVITDVWLRSGRESVRIRRIAN